jgi:hypothetical protein
MYDPEEARWMGKRRFIADKKQMNKAERKMKKQFIEDSIEDYDNDYYDHYDY